MNLLQNIINLDSLSLLHGFDCLSQKDLPFFIFIKDKVGRYLNCNDAIASTAGLSKSNDLLGLTDFDVCWGNYAARVSQNDKEVIKTEKQRIVVEQGCNFNNKPMVVTSIKSPLRSRSKKIIGISGLSIIHKESFHAAKNVDYSFLTLRERECLSHLIKGNTAQQIGDVLNISRRTVEKHLDNIKSKLYCKKKSELIDKAIQMDLFI